MHNLLLMFFALHLTYVDSQTCKNILKKTSIETIVASSPIVIEVKPTKLTSTKKSALVNVTGTVTKVFETRNGGLKKGSELTFGPVGKSKGCVNVKTGKTILVFLEEPNEDGSYFIRYNPEKSKKRTRKLPKLLCNGCLLAASFKKKSKTLKKKEGSKLKIRCKANGKPMPQLSWYYNGVLLTKFNTPKSLKIKNKKKSSLLEVTHLSTDFDGKKFICSATNVLSSQAANYTITVKVTKARTATCGRHCTETDANYCVHGVCCLEANDSPLCLCKTGWDGQRCNKRAIIAPVIKKNDTSKNSRNQLRLITVLGICMALLSVLFLCFGAYCVFKKKRMEMHRKTLGNEYEPPEAAPMLQLNKDSEERISAKDGSCNGVVNRIEIDCPRSKSSQLNNFSQHEKKLKSSKEEFLEKEAVEPHQRIHSKLTQKDSVTSQNGKRGRLNGVAKSESRGLSVKQKQSKTVHQSDSRSTAILEMQKDSMRPHKIKSDDLSSNPPLSHNKICASPSLPLSDSTPRILKNQSLNVSDISSSQKELHVAYAVRSDLKTRSQLLPTSKMNCRTCPVSTFNPEGKVRKDVQDKLLVVASQTPTGSSKCIHSRAYSSTLVHLRHGSSDLCDPTEPCNKNECGKSRTCLKPSEFQNGLDSKTSFPNDCLAEVKIFKVSPELETSTPQHSLNSPLRT